MTPQVSAGQRVNQSAPSRPPRTALGNLPWPITTLIGREDKIAAACALLRRNDVRLVTFTGSGGVGKTQLALAVARKLSDDFADGVALVPLAPIGDPALVPWAIAQELDVRDHGGRPLLDVLRTAIGDRKLLVVMDNFEHLLPAAPVVADLLVASPRLKVLATSRELLHVSGEHAFVVPTLGLPDASKPMSTTELAESHAISLFVVRAKEANPDFVLTDANADAVAAICRSVDGLPLAIELSAARVQFLSPKELRAQLTNRLPLLTGGRRDAPDRLQTMRNAIAWSYDLLSPPEQALFTRLSIFVGGFTLEAARAVMPERDVLDDLFSLVGKSLVQQAEQSSGETRFTMLETIREYGLEQLAASSEAADLRARHFAYFLTMAEQADRIPISPAKEIASRRLEAELPNFRAALAWAEERHDAERMLRLALAFSWFWETGGSINEGSAWMERTIEATAGVLPALNGQRAQLLASAAYFAQLVGDSEHAAALLDEASILARETGDDRASAMVAWSTGALVIWADDLDSAETHLTDALARWRNLNDSHWIVRSLFCLGFIAALRGAPNKAESWLAEALALAQAEGWPSLIALGLEALGTCAREQGDHQRAVRLFAEALSLASGGHLGTQALCLKSLGAIAAVYGKAEQAARLFGAAEMTRERGGYRDDPAAERLRLERAYAPARAQLSADEFAAAWAAGRELPLDQAIAEALEVARKVISEQSVGPKESSGLTPRELDVLRLLVEGLADKEIGEALGMSRRTASKHVETILNKLDVPSRTAAATYATRHGLV
jgi:serine/threonine-protein kinase PknK